MPIVPTTSKNSSVIAMKPLPNPLKSNSKKAAPAGQSQHDPSKLKPLPFAITCPRRNMYLIMDLMAKQFPGHCNDEFDEDPVLGLFYFALPTIIPSPTPNPLMLTSFKNRTNFSKSMSAFPLAALAMQQCHTAAMQLVYR
jgi:hypothetical protein